MRYLQLSDVKLQVTAENDIDDVLLTQLGDAAEDATERYIGQPLSACVGEDGQLAPAIRRAILMLVATMYDNRESVTFAQAHVSPAYAICLGPFIKYY